MTKLQMAMSALWTLSLILGGISFVAYCYYQIKFCLQPSWISDEAFRLQGDYLMSLFIAIVFCAGSLIFYAFMGAPK